MRSLIRPRPIRSPKTAFARPASAYTSPNSKESPMRRREFLTTAASVVVAPIAGRLAAAAERRLVYAAAPGIRNYLEYGGIGVLVFDVAAGHKFVKRIDTWPLVPGQDAENVKGIAAHADTGRLFVSTIKRLAALDLSTDRKIW